MEDEIVKIRIKIGTTEIEYEGKALFIQEGITKLLGDVLGVCTERSKEGQQDDIPKETGGSPSDGIRHHFGHSTDTIAAFLQSKSASDLLIAAAAHLTFETGKQTFTRQDLGEEMKGATAFYNKNMRSNLTKTLESLVKARRINHTGKDAYALSGSEKHSLEKKIASIK